MKCLLIGFLITIVLIGQAQNIEVLNFNQLEYRFSTTSDSVYVINFWATWCKPCVEELPGFFKLEDEMKNEKFKLLLVSLDFSDHVDSRVIPFIKKHNITTEVVLLDDPDANTWINKVNSNWDGSIPITVVFTKDKRKFIDSAVSYEKLKKVVNNIY